MATTPAIEQPPTIPTPLPEIIEALRRVGPLNGLSDDEYAWLATNGIERKTPDGTLIFNEGDPVTHMILSLHGEVQVRRRNTGPIAMFIARAGQITGKLPFSRMKAYGGDGVAIGNSWILAIPEALFPQMLAAIPSMAQRCVTVLVDRVREVTRIEQQADKLAALGKLSANLAHELNNPASAAQRSAASLFGELRDYGQQKYALGAACLTPAETANYQQWLKNTRETIANYDHLSTGEDSLAAADREDTLQRWLESHHVADPWKIAPTLAETGVTIAQLDDLAAVTRTDLLGLAISTFATSVRVERMAETVVNSTVRIFDLITAIKDYSYMDQAPIQDIDVAQSLENTLTMFASRIEKIKVVRDFAPDLPHISAYGSELNQVFTEIIENALDAMQDSGTLSLKTKLSGNMVMVEVWDSGPGIDPANKQRIFEPFFSTKPVGTGLGLGLDSANRIVARHSGFITVESKPGATCFQIRLPIQQVEAY